MVLIGLFALNKASDVFLGLAVLSFGLIGLLWPQVLLMAVTLVIPLFPKLPLIAIKGYVIPVRLDDLLVIFACLVVLLRETQQKTLLKHVRLALWFLPFLALSFASTMWSVSVLGAVDLKTGLLYWLRILEYFSVFFLAVYEVVTHRRFRMILYGAFVALFLVGVYGILQRYGYVPVFSALHPDDQLLVEASLTGGWNERLFSTFGGPYELAGYYVVVLPVAVSFLLDEPRKLRRFLLAATVILSFTCMYFTYARAVLPSMGIALGVVFIVVRKKALGIVLCALGAVPLLVFSQLEFFRYRISLFFNDPLSDPSTADRVINRWGIALDSFYESPWVGTGLGSLDKRGFGVDGFYMLLLGMVGIIGVVTFLTLIAFILRFQWISFNTKKVALPLRKLAAGLLGATAGLIIYSIFTDGFFVSKIALTFWFLNGLLYAGHRLSTKQALPQGCGVSG